MWNPTVLVFIDNDHHNYAIINSINDVKDNDNYDKQRKSIDARQNTEFV